MVAGNASGIPGWRMDVRKHRRFGVMVTWTEFRSAGVPLRVIADLGGVSVEGLIRKDTHLERLFEVIEASTELSELILENASAARLRAAARSAATTAATGSAACACRWATRASAFRSTC